jgi:hypothetical protein
VSYIVQPSVGNGGSATAVSAGTVVATVASGSLPAGSYLVQANVAAPTGAGVGAGDFANVGLYNGATLVSVVTPGSQPMTVAMTGSSALALKIVGTPGASTVVYAGSFSATLIKSN